MSTPTTATVAATAARSAWDGLETGVVTGVVGAEEVAMEVWKKKSGIEASLFILVHLGTVSCTAPGATTSPPTGRSPSRSHTPGCSPPARTPVSPSSATTSPGSPPKACPSPLAPARSHPPDLALTQILDVFALLTETYPRYIDTPSRDAVQHIGMLLVHRDESIRDTPKLGVLDNVLGWLAHEVAHLSRSALRLSLVPRPLTASSSYAAADLFVLLSWACGLYTTSLAASPDLASSDAWRVLTGVLATLLDLQLNPSTQSKPTMQKSALVRTRRALRSAPKQLHLLISTLVSQAKSSQTPLVYIPLLSTAVDVMIRLKSIKDESLKQVPKVRAHRPWAFLADLPQEGIVNLYTTHVLMSKTAVPAHTSVRRFTNTRHPAHRLQNALGDFIRTTITPDDFSTSILPTMEKALLRSPEYSLSGRPSLARICRLLDVL
jgi:hypothetical protein